MASNTSIFDTIWNSFADLHALQGGSPDEIYEECQTLLEKASAEVDRIVEGAEASSAAIDFAKLSQLFVAFSIYRGLLSRLQAILKAKSAELPQRIVHALVDLEGVQLTGYTQLQWLVVKGVPEAEQRGSFVSARLESAERQAINGLISLETTWLKFAPDTVPSKLFGELVSRLEKHRAEESAMLAQLASA